MTRRTNNRIERKRVEKSNFYVKEFKKRLRENKRYKELSEKEGSSTREERLLQRSIRRRMEKRYRKYVATNNEWSNLHKYHRAVKDKFKPIFILLDKCTAFKPEQYLSKVQRSVLIDLITLLKLDCISFSKDLELIYNIHKEREGHCSLEDWQLMIDIGEKYFLFKEFFDAIIPPVYDHIIDIIRLAEENKSLLENKPTSPKDETVDPIDNIKEEENE